MNGFRSEADMKYHSVMLAEPEIDAVLEHRQEEHRIPVGRLKGRVNRGDRLLIGAAIQLEVTNLRTEKHGDQVFYVLDLKLVGR